METVLLVCEDVARTQALTVAFSQGGFCVKVYTAATDAARELERVGAMPTFLVGDVENAIHQLSGLRRARSDAPVFMLDMMPIASWHREGLRTPPEQIQRQYEFARAAGIEVIQLGDLYLHDHLEDAPWGSPPFKSGHGSPWSLDGAAERIADHLYPRLAKHFREREPNWTKPPPEELAERGPDLASALSELDETAVESLPELGEDAVRVESRPDALDILVEVRGKKLKQADPEDLALAGILAAIAENELRGRALEVRVRLVEFTNFDEYGAGVLDGATILWDRSFDVEGLRAFVETSG